MDKFGWMEADGYVGGDTLQIRGRNHRITYYKISKMTPATYKRFLKLFSRYNFDIDSYVECGTKFTEFKRRNSRK